MRDHRQRRDINDALDREDALSSNLDGMSQYVRGLRERVEELHPKIVRYRVEAALDELHAQAPAEGATTVMTAEGPRCDPACHV